MVVVISDHGAKCYETLIMEEAEWERAYAAREIMKKAGLAVTKKNPETGKEEYDWSKTKAAAVRDCFIYVNLEGGAIRTESLSPGRSMTGLWSRRSQRCGRTWTRSLAFRRSRWC